MNGLKKILLYFQNFKQSLRIQTLLILLFFIFRSFSESVNSAKDYAKKCLKGLSKTIITVTIFNTEKVHIKNSNSICGNKNERNNYIARGRCGNRAKKNTSKCWNNLINNMSNAKKVKNVKLRIPLFCCLFYNWRKCTVDTFKSLGPKVCSDSAIEGFDAQIVRGALDPLNTFCYEHNQDSDQSDKCDKLTELIPKVRSNRSRNKTPFSATFELFDSL